MYLVEGLGISTKKHNLLDYSWFITKMHHFSYIFPLPLVSTSLLWNHWILLVAYQYTPCQICEYTNHISWFGLRVRNMIPSPFFSGPEEENKKKGTKTRKATTTRNTDITWWPITSYSKWLPPQVTKPEGTSPLLRLRHGSLALNGRVKFGMSRQDGVLVLLFTGAFGDEWDARDG